MTIENQENPCTTVKILSKTVEKLDIRVEKIDEKIDKVDEKVNLIDKRGLISEILIDKMEKAFTKNSEVMESLGETIHRIEKFLDALQPNLENWNKNVNQNRDDIVKAEGKTEILEQLMRDSDEKSKIDLRVILKGFFSNKITWLVGIILILIEGLVNIDWASLIEHFVK